MAPRKLATPQHKSPQSKTRSGHVRKRSSRTRPDTLQNKVLKLLGDESISVDVDAEAHFVEDLDLVVLGSPPDTYRNYSEALRKEYAHMTDESYRAMRQKILETFIYVLPSIYNTKKFRDLFEETAKINISKEIDEFKGFP